MNEQLLKAVTRLFAIVAKERVTEDERLKIEEFLTEHVDKSQLSEYLEIFDRYSQTRLMSKALVHAGEDEPGGIDEETQEFVIDWATIMETCKLINQEQTEYQKLFLLLKIIELILADDEVSERQNNLLFYIAKAVKIEKRWVDKLINFVMAIDVPELSDPNVLIIDDGSEEDYLKCKHIEVENITGFIAFLYLPNLETYLVKYLGISPVRLNGIPLRSRTVTVFPAGSTIRGDKLQPIFYSAVASKFKKSEEGTKLTLEARNIHYTFKSGKKGIQDVYLKETSGNLIGVMGASGSGKSTLFDLLNTKRRPTRGEVILNGHNIYNEEHEIQGLIGHVPQDDLLIEDLTVYQNLFYAAELCFKNKTREEIEELTNKTLQNLGLLDIQNLKVGSPLNKVISGGQRKRLNIALELIREPSIMFLDEPTSGLSSRDSENIMDLLKELTLRGKMVFVIIHQPSSDIFKMFDSLIILDENGYQIYYGDPVAAPVYFKEINNMVNRDQGACITCGNVNVEQVFNIIETRVVDEYGRFTDRRKITPKEWNEHFKKRFAIQPASIQQPQKLPPTSFEVPNKTKQYTVFSKRDILAKLSNHQYLLINLLEAPALAFLLSYFVKYFNTQSENAHYIFRENINIPSFFFMSVIVALFMGLTVSAEELIKDRKILEREKFLNLSRSSYLAAKISVLFFISIIQTLLFVWVSTQILEIRDIILSYWLTLFSLSCLANIIGLIISSAFNSAITVYILIPLILIPQLIFSGVVFPFDKLNPEITRQDKVPWFGELMASRWGFEALMVKQFMGNAYTEKTYAFDQQIAQSEYKMTYLIPELELLLEESAAAFYYGEGKIKVGQHLRVIRNEIQNELELIGQDKYTLLDKLTEAKFDSTIYKNTWQFLEVLRKMYINKYQKALYKRDSMMIAWEVEEGQEQLLSLKNRHTNARLEELAKNVITRDRIMEGENTLIRKIFPIYFPAENQSGMLDFTSHFYAPQKHFGGYFFNTPAFNISVLWVFIILLIGILYFDILSRIVQFLDWLGTYIIPFYVKRQRLKFKKILKKKSNAR